MHLDAPYPKMLLGTPCSRMFCNARHWRRRSSPLDAHHCSLPTACCHSAVSSPAPLLWFPVHHAEIRTCRAGVGGLRGGQSTSWHWSSSHSGLYAYGTGLLSYRMCLSFSHFFLAWYINYYLEHILWENILNTKTIVLHNVFFHYLFFLKITCIYFGDCQHSIIQPISIWNLLYESLCDPMWSVNTFKRNLAPSTPWLDSVEVSIQNTPWILF